MVDRFTTRIISNRLIPPGIASAKVWKEDGELVEYSDYKRLEEALKAIRGLSSGVYDVIYNIANKALEGK